MKEYYVQLHAKGFKHKDRFCGFDDCCAHFTTGKDVSKWSYEWKEAYDKAVDFYGKQKVRNGWTGYTVGDVYIKTGDEKLTAMSPAYGYGHRSTPIYEKIFED